MAYPLINVSVLSSQPSYGLACANHRVLVSRFLFFLAVLINYYLKMFSGLFVSYLLNISHKTYLIIYLSFIDTLPGYRYSIYCEICQNKCICKNCRNFYK